MAQVTITTEQLELLQRMIAKLSDDKAAADNATAASSAAQAELQLAQANVAMKNAAVMQLDDVVAGDVVKLQATIGTLITDAKSKVRA